MRIRRVLPRRPRSTSVWDLLEAHSQTIDEAAWYAERLERLGRAMFGDLWDSEKSQPQTEMKKNHE